MYRLRLVKSSKKVMPKPGGWSICLCGRRHVLMMHVVAFPNAHQSHANHPDEVHGEQANADPGICRTGKIGQKDV